MPQFVAHGMFPWKRIKLQRRSVDEGVWGNPTARAESCWAATVVFKSAALSSSLSLALLCSAACGGRNWAASSGENAGHRTAAEQPPREELNANEIVFKLRGNESALRRCFFVSPGARGTVSLSWSVNSDGRVEHLKRERSTISDARIERCLGQRLGELRFDRRDVPTRGRWTFVFRLAESRRDPAGRDGRTGRRARDRADDSEPGVQLEKSSPGTLDLTEVDNVVEAGFPLFARCYRDGVERSSSLGGAVRLRLVVGNAGEVTTVEDHGSDLTDRQVVDCVAEGFYALRFPEPQRGEAHLVYRIHFDIG